MSSCLGVENSTLYLYEAVVYDDDRIHTFIAYNMISERHNNISIIGSQDVWNGVLPP